MTDQTSNCPCHCHHGNLSQCFTDCLTRSCKDCYPITKPIFHLDAERNKIKFTHPLHEKDGKLCNQTRCDVIEMTRVPPATQPDEEKSKCCNAPIVEWGEDVGIMVAAKPSKYSFCSKCRRNNFGSNVQSDDDLLENWEEEFDYELLGSIDEETFKAGDLNFDRYLRKHPEFRLCKKGNKEYWVSDNFAVTVPEVKQFIARLLRAVEQKTRHEALSRMKSEHDKYCGKLEEKDGWFEMAKKKLSYNDQN